MSKPKLMPTGRRFMTLLAVWLAAAASLTAVPAAPVAEPIFETRVVDVRIENVSLERVDVSMQIAVRASRHVTIRTLTFSDGYIDSVPVWVAPLDGRWPLRKGEEFVIPPRVLVTAYARDALASGGLARLIGRDEVDARATAEMSFDMPWVARMLRTATGVAITEVAFKAPVPAPSPLMQPLARLGAGVVEFLQRQAAPLLAGGPGGQAASRDVIDRFGRSVATVETAYEIEGGPAPGPRTAKTLGLWWTPSIYCTTREAFEPWRYGAADASQLQIQGARLRAGSTRVEITSASAPPIKLDPDELRRRLPKGTNRSVYLPGHRRASPDERRRAHGAVRAALPASRRRYGPAGLDGRGAHVAGTRRGVRGRGLPGAGLDGRGRSRRIRDDAAHAGPSPVARLTARERPGGRGTGRLARCGVGRRRDCRGGRARGARQRSYGSTRRAMNGSTPPGAGLKTRGHVRGRPWCKPTRW